MIVVGVVRSNNHNKRTVVIVVVIVDQISINETRTSSREFCDALLLNDIELEKLLPPDKNQKNSLSKTIKDSSWYFLSWGNDPTIKSMLVMLDAIHNKFNIADSFFDRLISPDNPVITFQFFNSLSSFVLIY